MILFKIYTHYNYTTLDNKLIPNIPLTLLLPMDPLIGEAQAALSALNLVVPINTL